jgi:magnesium transporter
LAVEESKSRFHAPKLFFYDHHLFIVWNAIVDRPGTSKLELAELDVFLGPGYLITVHHQPLGFLDFQRELVLKDPKLISEGADWLLYSLLDSVVDEIFPLLDRLSDEIDRLENEIFEKSSQEQIRKLFVLKRQLLTLRKVVTPEREVVNLLTRHGSKLIRAETYIYYQDIYDHLIRIVDLIDTDRDVISGAMDIYLSAVSNRMNEVMKKLTVVATIFMPLTFIVGVYGMNFRYMPELYQPWGYFAVWAVMVILAVGMLAYFRIKDWW